MNIKESECSVRREKRREPLRIEDTNQQESESTLQMDSRELSPDIPGLGAQLYTHAELHDGDIPNERSVCDTLSTLAPFVKTRVPWEENSMDRLRIVSKNETEEETVRELSKWILGTTVILCHSLTVLLKNDLQCRAVIDAVKFVGRKVEITLSADDSHSIWEDTDIWMFPTDPATSSSPYSIEPNTSTASETVPEDPVKKPIDLSQEELFQLIHSWKYLGGKFQRLRRKYGDKWKNVYLTELRMTPVDGKKKALLEFVKEDTILRLSNDIEEIGEIFVEVCRKTIKKSEKSITFSIAGFTRSDVDIPLSKQMTYYLHVDDTDDVEWGSQTSEVDVLPGYPLEQNLDELCEKLGQLKVSDVSIKTWFAAPNNVVFIRLVVTSTKHQMMHFKKLHGVHVILQNTVNDKQMVLAVVSKVMKDEMILTLKAVPKQGRYYCFEKENTITIQIDHAYEQRLEQLQGMSAKMESIRRQLISHDSDIRLVRDWRTMDIKKRTFATFSFKNKAIASIPCNTKVLLSKCWEAEGLLERKSDFVFAVRVENNKESPYLVTFEIKYTRSLIENRREFELSKAFYYLDFDASDSIMKDPYYTLLDARCATTNNVASRSQPVNEQLKFLIVPFSPWKPRGNGGSSQTSFPSKSSQTSSDSGSRKSDEKNSRRPTVPQQQNRTMLKTSFSTERTKPVSAPPTTAKLSLKIDPTRHHNRGFVYLSNLPYYEKSQQTIVIRFDFNDAREKTKSAPLDIGKRIVLTEGVDHDEIKIAGDVHDTLGETVTIGIDQKVSDLQFLRRWNKTTQLLSYEEK